MRRAILTLVCSLLVGLAQSNQQDFSMVTGTIDISAIKRMPFEEEQISVRDNFTFKVWRFEESFQKRTAERDNLTGAICFGGETNFQSETARIGFYVRLLKVSETRITVEI